MTIFSKTHQDSRRNVQLWYAANCYATCSIIQLVETILSFNFLRLVEFSYCTPQHSTYLRDKNQVP